MRVRPPRGSAVLFYSMLPDGNGDELSLHSGEAVTDGVKWVCNLWVSDYGADRLLAHNKAQHSDNTDIESES